MHDITGDEVALAMARTASAVTFYRFGYTELRTPILSDALFLHSLGDTTDIVQKEMYALEDRGGRSLALRPEGTAGVMRHLPFGRRGTGGSVIIWGLCFVASVLRQEESVNFIKLS